MGSHSRFKERIYAKKRENLSLVQTRERRSKGVYSEIDKEGIYTTIKVITNCTSILYKKERWKEKGWYKIISILISGQ